MSRIRTALVGTIAAGVMLATYAAPASAAPVAVISTHGRNAPTYTSYPTDPTPTSKWVASAQGEYVDSTPSPKPDGDALRGRGAVQESFGVKRVRIYDVKLQEWRAGKWVTVASRSNLPDAINESSKAFVQAYTPTVKTCWWDDFVGTYRVVNEHGIRRVDNVVANRTTFSKTFKGPRLATDPTCPTGVITGGVFAPGEEHAGTSSFASSTVGYFSRINQPAQNVNITVNWGDGWAVSRVADGYEPVENTPDPNDYTRSVASLPDSALENEIEDDWNLTAETPGEWTSTITITTSTPRIVVQYEEPSKSTITDEASVDVEVHASLPEDLNTDKDPNAEGLQVDGGDLVVYELEATNNGPDEAPVALTDDSWSSRIAEVTRVGGRGSMEPYEPIEPGYNFIWPISKPLMTDEVVSLLVEVRTKSVSSTEEVKLGFRGDPVQANDPNPDNSIGSASFDILDGETVQARPSS